ncbi:hypothetical protein [Peristeroidobacter agariperforans]|uniref:hypothetical protein n=1 Tax=Peristeroidobacter agariperforans TaxID=268404 RepID=UPI00101BA88F|nr:hypothetical protein [Peristeroidobacter agariperforans]
MRACLAIALLPLLSACVYTYVKPDGSVVMIGLNKVTLPAGTSADGARTISSSAIGVSLFRTPLGSSLALGYNREGFTVVSEAPRIAAAACLSADGTVSNTEQGTQYVSSIPEDVPVRLWRDHVGLFDLGLLRY